MELAGSVAAPLLASVSFALMALVLPLTSLRYPLRNWALLFFIGAGVGFISTVQAEGWERRYRRSLTEAKKWETLGRWSYHAAVMALLLGLFMVLVPHATPPDTRMATLAVIAAALAGEGAWIGLSLWRDHLARSR